MSSGTGVGFRCSDRSAGLRPSAIREILKVTSSPDVISFAGGLPAPELFPLADVRLAAEEALRADGPASLQYAATEGFPPLREWVCGHLARTVGLRASPDRILVTNGSQQGIDLVARVLLDPGDSVLVEDPAYLGALQAFRACGAAVVGLASDAEGILPEALSRAVRPGGRRPKLLYLAPNFQNPTGGTLSRRRREAVVDIAARAGVPILEDDPYGLLRYSGSGEPALGALAGGRDCLYLGTASKILAPGLRVAWLVSPDDGIYSRLIAAKQAADLHTSSLTQRIVANLVLRPGLLEAHLGRLRAAYCERRDAMLSALGRRLPAGSSWTRPEGGLFLWVELPEGTDTDELLTAALHRKVAFVPGSAFWVGVGDRRHLRLNFSNASPDRIVEGVERLGQALRSSEPAPARARRLGPRPGRAS
jgi:2-aminoadipate transaminase